MSVFYTKQVFLISWANNNTMQVIYASHCNIRKDFVQSLESIIRVCQIYLQ